MITARRLKDASSLKVGQTVHLVRDDGMDPEPFIVTVCPPYIPPSPIGRSLVTGISRVLVPSCPEEAFYILGREPEKEVVPNL